MTDVPLPPRVRGVDLKARPLRIVAPEHGVYPKTAERLRRALARATGQEVRVLGDGASAGEVSDGNVVALGNLMDSAFVRRLYLAWYDWTDAAWPGPGGWALRTVVDPWGVGAHAILAGGSDPEGVSAAADALIWHVEKDRTGLPLLHEVHLGRLAEAYHKAVGPILDPGFDWGEEGGGGSGSWDFMMRIADAGKGFLYTGDRRFLGLYRDKLLRFFDTHWFNRRREEPVQIHGFIHHMLLPWELTEHQPVFSDDHRRQVFEAFLHLYRSTEGAARPVFLSELRKRRVRGNHDTRNALDLYFGGRYFQRVARLPEAAEWLRLADGFLAPQAASSKPWEDSWGHQWSASLYNVAVYKAAVGDEAYFQGRPFLDAADRAVIAHSNLRRGPLQYFALAAVATGNREYLHPVRMLERAAAEQGGDGAAAVRRNRGDEVGRAFWTGWEAETPERLLGVSVAPLDGLYHGTARERDGGYAAVATENVPAEKGFDKVSFREGFDTRDQYLLLDGISGGGHSYQDANCIVSFEALGRVWVNAFATGGRPASVREQNGVNIVRDGRGPGREPRFAYLQDAGDFGAWGATGSSMLDLNGADWHRHVFWRRGAYFLVVDEVAAAEGGDYLIEPTWYISGETLAQGRTLTSRQGEAAHLTALHTGARWCEAAPYPADRRGGADLSRWRQRLRCAMKPGDRRTLATFFAATEGAGSDRFGLVLTSAGWRVTVDGVETAFGLRGRAEGEEMIQARAWTASAEEVLLWGCSWLACGGVMLATSAPVGIRIRPTELEISARERVEVRLKGYPGTVRVQGPDGDQGERIWTDGQGRGTVWVEAGRSRLDLPGEGLLAGLRAMLDGGDRVREASPSAPKFVPRKGKDLTDLFSTTLDGVVTTLAIGQDGVSAGTQEGIVAGMGLDGSVRWRFESGMPVRATLREDLDGDGAEETATGGNGETLHLLGADGAERWRHRIVWQPMQWENWSQYDCKVLSLGAGDLDGDGRLELAVGCADRHCYAVSLSGERLWRAPVQWGPMVCCAVADVDGDGRAEVLGGCADPAIHGHCLVFRGDGALDRAICRPDVHSWSVPSWMTVLMTEDLDGEGCPEILTGVNTNHRQLIVYRWPGEVVWDADFGSGISAVAVGGNAGCRTVFGGSAGGAVQAFSAGGERRWWRFLGAPVAGLAAFGDRVAAVTSSGGLTVFDADGRMRQGVRIPAGVRTVAVREGLLVVGREDGVVQGFSVH